MKTCTVGVAWLVCLCFGTAADAQGRKATFVAVALDRPLETQAVLAGLELGRLMRKDERLDVIEALALALGDGRSRKASEADALLTEALGFLDEMNEKAALQRAQAATAAYEEVGLSSAFPGLLDSLATQALAHFASKEEGAARDALVKVFALRREYMVDPRRSSPEFLALAASARAAVASARATLDATSTPVPAQVFIDGVSRGVTPLSVPGLTLGIHYVTLQATGYELVQERWVGGAGAQVKAVLRPAARERGLLDLLRAIQSAAPPGSGGSAGALAQWAGAHEVVVLALRQKEGVVRATLARYMADGALGAMVEGPMGSSQALEGLCARLRAIETEPPFPPPPTAVSQADAPGTEWSAPPSAVRGSAKGGLLDGVYLSAGIGSGEGAYFLRGTLRSFGGVIGTALPFAIQIGAGVSLSPKVRLGADVRFLRSQSTTRAEGLQMTDYTAMLTWFPAETGFFVHGGVGLTTLSIVNIQYNRTLSETSLGLAGVAGLGYAFVLGDALRLTLSGDFSAAAILTSAVDRPTSAGFFDVCLGLAWR